MADCIDQMQNSNQIKSYDTLADSLVAPAQQQFLATFSCFSRTQMGGEIFVGYTSYKSFIKGSSGPGHVALLCVQ